MTTEPKRAHNFNAGPSVLPVSVLAASSGGIAGFPRHWHVCHGDQSPLEGI